MNDNDIEQLSAQISNIILNQPITQELKTTSKELFDLQELISYLAQCVSEASEFAQKLSVGDFKEEAPGRYNFLAGSLKALQAGLRHLTWQANQVANGDYGQRVSFLGEFSDSFNKMIVQLEDRENQLKNQTKSIIKSMDLLVAIMDGLSDWIMVIQEATGNVLYVNQSAKKLFYDLETSLTICGKKCPLIEYLRSYQNKTDDLTYEFFCPYNGKTLYSKSFFIEWDGQMAYAHLISDITLDKGKKDELEDMVFKDELTGLHNRRYCLQQLNELIAQQLSFAICLMDLDGLKIVNDRFGHTYGDNYIKTIAQEMLRIGSKEDIICRMGGDEFIAIFPNCSEPLAQEKIRTLDRNVASIPSEHLMSVSHGVVYVPAGKKVFSETILAQVDAKMYLDKNAKKEKLNALKT